MPDSATPIPPGVRAIPLGGKHARGRVAWVDEWNYDRVRARSWHCWERWRDGRLRNGPYPQGKDPATGRLVKMHNFITGRRYIDHANGDGLDCRESNLRDATASQNGANRGKRRTGGTSKYKGVHWDERNRKWRAMISRNRRARPLGRFTNEQDAARVYDEAAKHLHGEFAWLNRDHFPELR